MTTRLYLVRHGATTLSAEDRFAGATDVALSDEGRQQAEGLAHRLADDAITSVYCSPMSRTVETATILARPHGLTPIPDAALREIDHGRWETLRRKDVETLFPEEYAAWEGDPFIFAPEGGESGASVLARSLPFIRQIALNHLGENVIVVSHKATIRLIMCSLLGIDPRGYRDRMDQAPACLNVLDFKDTVRVRLMLYNDISHYGQEPKRAAGRLSKWWDTEKPA